ncbi:DUF6069 family protein [Solicola gregarius]|uniref:DUF6069 family protein n=1 Tax=Solicola gregarius TaxID=2908642 RepID=A0AA46TFB0_9ACTN|nr:DUF6069 family protein [Solicola gregarius]UYM03518.1 DUF6069 family protein [Solicola gregarius]
MYDNRPEPPPPDQPKVDAARLWAGGVATAVVAALIAVVGDLIARGVLDIPVLAPESRGTWHSASLVPYALGAAAGALVATGLMHVLTLTTPRPTMFFGWIMFLVGVVVGVWPFTTGASLEAKLATAVLDVVIVLAIWSLIDGTARRTTRLPAR